MPKQDRWNDPSNLAMMLCYGIAEQRLVEGQIVQVSRDGLRHGIKGGKGRVWGFPRAHRWCVLVKRDGNKYPSSYSHTFWEPT